MAESTTSIGVDLPFPSSQYHVVAPKRETLRSLYPPIEPYRGGLLDLGDGQQMAWEESGNRDGKPVVFVHGGPGGAGGRERHRFFDPDAYRIIVFDQRGCGNSQPHASEDPDLSANTTGHLIADMELLREALGVEKWLVFGGSWGSTLALAYAERHPDRVTELILRGVYTLRRNELDFFYNFGVSEIFPEWWQVFCEPLRRANHDFSQDNIAAYHELLFHDDPNIHLPAAVAWTAWEAATSSLEFDEAKIKQWSEPRHALAFARIENHYFTNNGFLREGQLLEEADRLSGIPTVIVQGRYDMPCAVTTAVELHRRLPQSELKLVLAGHSAFEPAILSELIVATDAFRGSAVRERSAGEQPASVPESTGETKAAPKDSYETIFRAHHDDSPSGREAAPIEVPPPGVQMPSPQRGEPTAEPLEPGVKKEVLRYLDRVRFSVADSERVGYRATSVDRFIDDIAAAVEAGGDVGAITSQAKFPIAAEGAEGYVATEVDDFIDLIDATMRGEGLAAKSKRPGGARRLFGTVNERNS